MFLGEKQGIDDNIALILAKNPYSTGPQLVAEVNKIRKNTTKQAVYVALKSLIKSEVVAKVGHTYFLSRVWLGKINELFQTQKEKELVRDAVFDLHEGESISYYFPNLLTCDTYWAHVFTMLIEWIPKEQPIFIWMPHEWFVIGRTEVEQGVFNAFEAYQKHALFTIGGTTALDMEFKRSWKNEFTQTHTIDERVFPRSYYLHIFDDFLIEVFVGQERTEEIERFYRETTTLTPEKISFFENLILKRTPVRMKISRKKKKAALLRKRLSKNFFIPKELEV